MVFYSVQLPEDAPWGPKHVGVFYMCNKCIEVHLLDIIIPNLMKMHGKHSIKEVWYIYF
jgi:hypothetical protein